MAEREVLVSVQNLKKYFEVGKKQTLKAVDDVTFNIYRGETLGLVGESGCGKSTLGRTIIQLYNATAGKVIFDGEDITAKLGRADLKEFTRRAQMIFQDPYASLNQRMKVIDIVAEGIDAHGLAGSRKEREDMVVALLETVGLDREHANRYPHEFSGGQRQRVGIARALAVNPDFIIADEPISALDVSIQAQVINLLQELQEKRGLTYLFIAHDLSMIKHISDRVGVMYLGSLVELTTSDELFERPLHPYTQAMFSAIPMADPKLEASRQRILLHGNVPSPINLGAGCRFAGRCPNATDRCRAETPVFTEVAPGHFVACHQVD
ncbi:MAG: ATP-binding cassette domain-containing protein [Oscillospiraceae bacterium]